jgi:hypothetical protein
MQIVIARSETTRQSRICGVRLLRLRAEAFRRAGRGFARGAPWVFNDGRKALHYKIFIVFVLAILL